MFITVDYQHNIYHSALRYWTKQKWQAQTSVWNLKEKMSCPRLVERKILESESQNWHDNDFNFSACLILISGMSTP